MSWKGILFLLSVDVDLVLIRLLEPVVMVQRRESTCRPVVVGLFCLLFFVCCLFFHLKYAWLALLIKKLILGENVQSQEEKEKKNKKKKKKKRRRRRKGVRKQESKKERKKERKKESKKKESKKESDKYENPE